jgi:hypothetical protein
VLFALASPHQSSSKLLPPTNVVIACSHFHCCASASVLLCS